MSEKQQRIWPERIPAVSPVDYSAWWKGYMPPSEHILIHKLSYESAWIQASMNFGDYEWWLVIKGNPDLRQLKNIAKSINGMIESEEEAIAKRAADHPRETADPS